jgi:hypothetical protein
MGVIFIIRKTSLNLLKVLAAMMSTMNLAWFIGCLSLFLGINHITNAATIEEVLTSDSATAFNWCACCYEVLFGLSHWIFVINYLTLAMRIKCSDPGKFKGHATWLNIMYYGVGALNACIPVF